MSALCRNGKDVDLLSGPPPKPLITRFTFDVALAFSFLPIPFLFECLCYLGFPCFHLSTLIFFFFAREITSTRPSVLFVLSLFLLSLPRFSLQTGFPIVVHRNAAWLRYLVF